MAAQSGRPGRTLIVLLALVVALVGLMGLSKTWTPKLGLDLQGGTTITLTAQNTSGSGSIDPKLPWPAISGTRIDQSWVILASAS